MLLKTLTEPLPTDEEISIRAYHVWNQAGRPQGLDREHWRQAEQELLAVHRQEDRALRHWEKSTGIRGKLGKRRTQYAT